MKSDELSLSIFTRKILCKIFSPVLDTGELKIRYNQALYQLYQSPDIIRSIKAASLWWAGHLWNGQQLNTQNKCRFKTLKEAGVWGDLNFGEWMVKDLRKFGIERWRILARCRQSWKRVLWEAEVHFGP